MMAERRPTLCPCVEQERPVCGDRCWHFGNEYPPCRLCGAPDRTAAPAPPTLNEKRVAGIFEAARLGIRRWFSAPSATQNAVTLEDLDELERSYAALRAEVARLTETLDVLMRRGLISPAEREHAYYRAARSSAAGEDHNG